jgi:hypothetical protein
MIRLPQQIRVSKWRWIGNGLVMSQKWNGTRNLGLHRIAVEDAKKGYQLEDLD